MDLFSKSPPQRLLDVGTDWKIAHRCRRRPNLINLWVSVGRHGR